MTSRLHRGASNRDGDLDPADARIVSDPIRQFGPEEVPSEIEKLSLSSHEYPRPDLRGVRPSTHRTI